jgi:hypothetical protein
LNFPFKLKGGDRYPALKQLRLEGYHFQEREWDETAYGSYYSVPWYEEVTDWILSGKAWKRALYSLNLSPSQRSKTNIDLWLDAMDWSQLESLAVKNKQFPFQVLPALQSLRELELETRNSSTALRIIGGLKNDSLTQFTKFGRQLVSMPSLLALQGRSLERLELRVEENMYEAGEAYNASDLALLRQEAPNLKHLSINLHRNGTWPLETLEAIASIPSLRSLDLWLDILSDCQRQKPSTYESSSVWNAWSEANGDCEGGNRFQTPFVNETSALELFRYLRELKAGEDLSNVTFWAGDWGRPYDGALRIDDYDWFQGRNAKVACSSVGNDIEEGDWCIVEAGEGYYLDGHIPKSQWEDWYDD